MPSRNFDSIGLIGFTISLGILSTLVDSGVISFEKAEALADHAVFQLEEHQSRFPRDRAAFEEARKFLNELRKGFETRR